MLTSSHSISNAPICCCRCRRLVKIYNACFAAGPRRHRVLYFVVLFHFREILSRDVAVNSVKYISFTAVRRWCAHCCRRLSRLAFSTMMFFKSLLVGAATLLSLVDGYASPLACSGTCTNAHDPSIIRRSSDGTYFRFSTGGKIAVHTASTLLGPWTYKGAALPSGSSINLSGNQDLWVLDPQLTFYDVANIISGPRCLQSRRHILPLLRRIHLR